MVEQQLKLQYLMFKCFLTFALFLVRLVLHKNSVPYVNVRRL
jgi:hypothetical protein